METYAQKRWPVTTGLLVTRMAPPTYLYVVAVHLTLALASGVPLVLSRTVSLSSLPYRRCTFLWMTGYPCPFCGVTRAFWLCGQGDWAAAWHECPLGIAVYGAVVLTFVVSLAGLVSRRILLPGRIFDVFRTRKKAALLCVMLLILLNWIYRLTAGLH